MAVSATVRLALVAVLVLVPVPAARAYHALVTGGSGYVGGEIVAQLRESGHTVTATYARKRPRDSKADAGVSWESLDIQDEEAISSLVRSRDSQGEPVSVVFHVAGVFRKDISDIYEDMVKPNIVSCESVVRAVSKEPSVKRLIITSSMAAVRGPGQPPLASAYSHEDWNTVSKIDQGWSGAYQFSKMKSEQRCWELADALGVSSKLTTLCPSMIFGPSRDKESTAYSLELVRGWVQGKSPVESRLSVDVRDVAKAHILCVDCPASAGQRLILSSERRLPAEELASIFRKVSGCPDIFPDTQFDGGAIAVGEREVFAEKRLKEILGVTCRPVAETMTDMVRSLL